MPAIRSSIPDELPFNRDGQALKALVTAGAFVALADGPVAAGRARPGGAIHRSAAACGNLKTAYRRIVRRTRATSPGEKLRGFDCRDPSTGSWSLTDLQCDSDRR